MSTCTILHTRFRAKRERLERSDGLSPESQGQFLDLTHPGGNPGANLKSIAHRCGIRKVALEWELTKETIYLPLGCLQGDVSYVPYSLDSGIRSSRIKDLLLKIFLRPTHGIPQDFQRRVATS